MKIRDFPGVIKFRIDRRWIEDKEFAIQMLVYDFDKRKRWIVKDIVMEESPLGYFSEEPPMVMSDDSAQQLLDQLWQAGLRPSQGLIGEEDARKQHLAHVTKLLDIVLPKALR